MKKIVSFILFAILLGSLGFFFLLSVKKVSASVQDDADMYDKYELYLKYEKIIYID